VSRTQRTWLAALAAQSMGCGLLGGYEPASEGDVDDDGAVSGTAGTAASGGTSGAGPSLPVLEAEVLWKQGEAPRTLGPQGQRYCFLTGLGGRFAGGGEWIAVRPSNGNWIVEGSSLQVGVHARARCLSWGPELPYAVESPRRWTHTTGDVLLGSSGDRFCALVEVAGVLTNSNVVRVRVATEWQVEGSATSLAAYARCLTGPLAYDGPYDWAASSPAKPIGERLACALTRAAGPLTNTGILHVVANGEWRVGGNQGAASAHCILGPRP
jgi:hypothetical protein